MANKKDLRSDEHIQDRARLLEAVTRMKAIPWPCSTQSHDFLECWAKIKEGLCKRLGDPCVRSSAGVVGLQEPPHPLPQGAVRAAPAPPVPANVVPPSWTAPQEYSEGVRGVLEAPSIVQRFGMGIGARFPVSVSSCAAQTRAPLSCFF